MDKRIFFTLKTLLLAAAFVLFSSFVLTAAGKSDQDSNVRKHKDSISVECSADGFGGEIYCLVTLDLNYEILKVEVLDASGETPGIAKPCFERSWLDQFIGSTIDTLPRNKYEFEDYGLDVVSGATRTSMAIVQCMRSAIEMAQE